jgi:hypothetical protein
MCGESAVHETATITQTADRRVQNRPGESYQVSEYWEAEVMFWGFACSTMVLALESNRSGVGPGTEP